MIRNPGSFALILCLSLVPLAAQNRQSFDAKSAERTAGIVAGPVLPRNPLDDFSQTVQRLISDVSPAVVAVVVQSFGQIEGESDGKTAAVGRQTREGTGVLVSADGYLI